MITKLPYNVLNINQHKKKFNILSGYIYFIEEDAIITELQSHLLGGINLLKQTTITTTIIRDLPNYRL